MADSPLQKSPRGLLELFALKTQGDAPREFGGVVQPSIDALAFYAADRLVVDRALGTVGAMPRTGTIYTFAQPTMIVTAVASAALGAAHGQVVSCSLFLQLPGGPNNVPVARSYFEDSLAAFPGPFFEAIWQPPFPLVVPAQTTLGARLDGDAAGADHKIDVKWLGLDLSSLR